MTVNWQDERRVYYFSDVMVSPFLVRLSHPTRIGDLPSQNEPHQMTFIYDHVDPLALAEMDVMP
jgi:hypothetical protein